MGIFKKIFCKKNTSNKNKFIKEYKKLCKKYGICLNTYYQAQTELREQWYIKDINSFRKKYPTDEEGCFRFDIFKEQIKDLESNEKK